MHSVDLELKGSNLFRIHRGRCKSGKADHYPIIIDEKKSHVTCGTCEEQLDPVQVLLTYAHGESRLVWRYSELKSLIDKQKFQIERKNRVRCEHCAKLTKVIK